MIRDLAAVSVGETLGPLAIRVRRSDLVRYAGASGDFNPIHWNERVAREVGLPGVIAHGMYTMGAAIRLVTDWAGDSGAVVDYGVRFSAMVPVPDDDAGAELTITGVVKEIGDDRQIRIDLTATADTAGGKKVLTQSRAVVRL